MRPSPREGSGRRQASSRSSCTTTSGRWTTSSPRSSDVAQNRTSPGWRPPSPPTDHCEPSGRSTLTSRGTAFTMEFVALANHRKAIRNEIARYAERFRATQLEALGAALEQSGIPADELPPVVALLLMTGLSQVISIEDALGVTSGHEDSMAFVERLLHELENRGKG